MSRKTAGRGTFEQGYAMVSMLIVVVILGALVAIVLEGSNSPTPAGPGTAITTPTTPQALAKVAPQAQVVACEADYTSLDTALGAYRALNGDYPAPGTAWASSPKNGGPFLQTWPTGAPSFRFAWNGSQLIVIPRKGVASRGSYGTSSPQTGCFAP